MVCRPFFRRLSVESASLVARYFFQFFLKEMISYTGDMENSNNPFTIDTESWLLQQQAFGGPQEEVPTSFQFLEQILRFALHQCI